MKKEIKSSQLSAISKNVRNPKSEIRNPKSSFTLIELLIVISIISILVTLLLPSLGRVQWTAKETAMMSRLTAVKASCDSFYTEYNRYPIATTAFGYEDLTGTGGPVNTTNKKVNSRKIKFYTGKIEDDWTGSGGIGILVDNDFNGQAETSLQGADADNVALNALTTSTGIALPSGSEKNVIITQGGVAFKIGANVPVVVFTGKGGAEQDEVLTTVGKFD